MKKIGELNLFRAFRSRNYSLYFVGRSVSQFGTWMQRTAVVWVVYSVAHSPFLIGATLFAEQFPSFLFSIMGGVAADRYNKYKVIKITQIISMIQSVMLAVLMLTGHTIIWAILALSVILGIINAFDVPARQSLIHDVVADKADLSNALSLTTATASLAQLLAPALSGIVLSAFGAATCFFINAASFAGVLISVLLMRVSPYVRKVSDKKVISEFKDGFSYVAKTMNIGIIILMVCVLGLLVWPYNTVVPVFAKVIFKGDASTFGYINSFIGVGAVTATIFLATRRPGAQLKLILFASIIIMAVGLILFSQVRNFPLAMFAAGMAGFGSIAQFTICNIIVQSEAAPHMRGRAIGIMLMAMFGMMPIGSLLVGGASEHIGAPATVLIEGIIAVVIVSVFARFLLQRGKPVVADELLVKEAEEIAAEQRG